MSNVITLPVTSFTSHDRLAAEINEIISSNKVDAVFFNKTSMLKGEYEFLVDHKEKNAFEEYEKILIQHVDRPSKFKENATSKYYCVYFDKFSQKWRYKFVRKNKVFNSKRFDTELEAAVMYDNHVYSVDGNTRKLNFPEKVFK